MTRFQLRWWIWKCLDKKDRPMHEAERANARSLIHVSREAVFRTWAHHQITRQQPYRYVKTHPIKQSNKNLMEKLKSVKRSNKNFEGSFLYWKPFRSRGKKIEWNGTLKFVIKLNSICKFYDVIFFINRFKWFAYRRCLYNDISRSM